MALALALVLSGCADSDNEQSATTATASTTPSATTTASTTTALPTTTTVVETTTVEPAAAYTERAAIETSTWVEEPYILHCNPGGLGPIETYWSDGSVTGWSEYCQEIRDQTLADEVAANTPVCDGTVCRYPSGATMPDPAAAPKTPSPWVQGQLDWQECKEAGNTDEYCRLTLN